MYEKVTVKIKVVDVKQQMQAGNKMKQDVIVADETSTARVVLWEEHMNCLRDKKSYCLKNFIVKKYQSTNYLTMSREGTEITLIEDIGNVAESIDDLDEIIEIKDVLIVGVPHLDTYRACIQCNGRVEPQTPPLGKCTRIDCKMMQRYDVCKENITAKLILMHSDEAQKKIIQVSAFGEVIREIAGGLEITPEVLLRASKLDSVTIFKHKNIIKNVKKC